MLSLMVKSSNKLAECAPQTAEDQNRLQEIRPRPSTAQHSGNRIYRSSELNVQQVMENASTVFIATLFLGSFSKKSYG